MLRAFRDNLKRLIWVLPIVIAVFIGFFLVDFSGTATGGLAGVSDAAATVGNETITFSQFQRAYEARETAMRRAYGEGFTRDTARQIGLPMQVMNELIAQRILGGEARRSGLKVTDAELREAILEQAAFRDSEGRFVGEDNYRALLRRAGYTPESFEDAMRGDLLTQKLQTVLADSIYVSAAEVERAYRDRVERAEIRYLRLPVARFAGQASVTPQAVESYFADNREEFRLPERRRVSYLLVDPAALEATVAVSDDEIRAYYEDHREEYTQDERVRARHILLRVADDAEAPAVAARMAAVRARVEAGEEFAALAAELSDDPGSKSRGGDLGFFGRGDMIGAFEDAAFGAAPGELVGPVRTSFGYHLIEVLERQPGGSRSLEEVRDEIYAALAAERAAALAERRARELAEQAQREKPASAAALEALAAGERGLLLRRPEPFARDDNVPRVGRATPFSAAAFELEQGESSQPVRITDGWAILHLEEVVAPRLPELDEVRDRVEQAVRDREQRAAAERRLTAARQQIASGGTLDEVAAGLDLEVQESGPFGPDGRIGALGSQPRLAAAALALEPGAVGGPVGVGGDLVLFEVTERQRFDPERFAAERQSTREELEQQRYGLLLGSLIERRQAELEISFDPTFLENFGSPTGTT